MSLEPEAWLLRETKGKRISIICGYMYKSEKMASEAAMRMTNHWRTVEVVPVVSLTKVDEWRAEL